MKNITKNLKIKLFIALTVLTLMPTFAFAQADPNVKRLSGSRLTINVDKPFGYSSSSQSAFPNGKDCANITLQATKSNGTFLEDEPLVIEKPDDIKIIGPQDTDFGSIRWCATSINPIQARITVKLRNYPRVQSSFNLNFKPDLRVTDKTDRNRFFYNLPITFTAQINPAMVPGLKKAKLVYTYDRSFNKWGFWKTRREQVIKNLKCTKDGLCTATIVPDNTNTKRVQRGTFSYTFSFEDQNGDVFTKTSSGHLRIP